MTYETRFAEYRKSTAAHVNNLKAQVEKLKQRADQEEVRAELAERATRSVAAERDIWKQRALDAEAILKSTGRAA